MIYGFHSDAFTCFKCEGNFISAADVSNAAVFVCFYFYMQCWLEASRYGKCHELLTFASLTHIFERFGKNEPSVERRAQLSLLPAPRLTRPVTVLLFLQLLTFSSSHFLIRQRQFPLFCLCLRSPSSLSPLPSPSVFLSSFPPQ